MSDPNQPGEIVVTYPAPAPAFTSAGMMGPEQFDNYSRMAKALVASGQFKDLTKWEQAFGRILLGADLGLTPTQALMSIDVVRGNVQIRGKRLLAWVKQSTNYDYEVLERSPERGTIRFYEKSKRTGEWQACQPDISFTLKEAEDAGLVKDGSAWRNWPANMCLWRCASIGVNLHCPDLTNGIPIYTEADSFEDRHEIGAGEGDGTGPGWGEMSPELVARVEAAIETAAEKGLSLSVETVQMRLHGQSEEDVLAWVEATEAET